MHDGNKARIRKLQKQLLPEADEGYQDDDAHKLPYFIGKSQNHPLNVPQFVRSNKDDPAAKDFIPKLKKHLLPRVYKSLLKEAEASPTEDANVPRIQLLKSLVRSSTEDPSFFNTPEAQFDADQQHLHSDRLYEHSVLHINYTSYDVRRETDIVNPKTSRRHVMCLRQANDDDDTQGCDVGTSTLPSGQAHSAQSPHRFQHARVLAVFHTNVVYRGRGSSDLRKQRFDLLYVRWFAFVDCYPARHRLDHLVFPPLNDPDAVGFLDPIDVLRASHIIPRYSLGPLHPDSQGSHRLYPPKCGSDPIVSKRVRDWEDWHEYFVNRFVDRDMVMRFLWGHGVGHTYCHSDAPPSITPPDDVTATMVGQPTTDTLPQSPSTDDIVESEHQDTLEDLEGEELSLSYGSEGEASDISQIGVQDPDDELGDDDQW